MGGSGTICTVTFERLREGMVQMLIPTSGDRHAPHESA
jgi:hypothetical protein